MPSHLGGFTSKSNKCHEDCFTKLKCSSAHKENLTQPLAWISHKSYKPYLEVKEEVSKAQRRVFSSVETAPSKGWRGELLYYLLKTSCWKLASRNSNFWFWNRNIWNLKYSRYRQNQIDLFFLVQ
jgi:hypothetical protein